MSKRSIDFVYDKLVNCDTVSISKYVQPQDVCVSPTGSVAHVPIEQTTLNAKTPWYINEIAVGWVFRASLMREMPALHHLDATLLAGSCIRRLGDKYLDENGRDISGFFEFRDVVKALLLMSPSSACHYSTTIGKLDFGDGPCLLYINAHTIPPTRHTMVSYVNLVNILARCPTMHFLRRDAVKVLIHRDMSSYTAIGSIDNTVQYNVLKCNEEQIITSHMESANGSVFQVQTTGLVENEETEVPLHVKTPWYRNQITIGFVFDAIALKTMPGLYNLDAIMLAGKHFRRLGKTGVDDNGNHIGELFVFSDVMVALGCIKDSRSANKYAKHRAHCHRAPSLVQIDAGQENGAQIILLSYTDLLTAVVAHPKMHFLRRDAVFALIDRDLSYFHKLPSSVYAEREKLTMAYVDSKITHCPTLPRIEYIVAKRNMWCSCGKFKIVCRVHGGSALCIVCNNVCYQQDLELHCAKCFVKQYPADARSVCLIVYQRWEIQVRERIDAAFDGFIHNKGIRKSTELRIDHRLLIDNTILAVETDEFAHRNYDPIKEKARYDEFLATTPYKFVFIRFNPDNNKESLDTKTTFEYKLSFLMRVITTQLDRIRKGHNIERLEISYYFC